MKRYRVMATASLRCYLDISANSADQAMAIAEGAGIWCWRIKAAPANRLPDNVIMAAPDSRGFPLPTSAGGIAGTLTLDYPPHRLPEWDYPNDTEARILPEITTITRDSSEESKQIWKLVEIAAQKTGGEK